MRDSGGAVEYVPGRSTSTMLREAEVISKFKLHATCQGGQLQPLECSLRASWVGTVPREERVGLAPAGMRGRTQRAGRGCSERAESPLPAAARDDGCAVAAREGRPLRTAGATTAAWVLHTAAYIVRVWTCVVRRAPPQLESSNVQLRTREEQAALRAARTLHGSGRIAHSRAQALRVCAACPGEARANRRRLRAWKPCDALQRPECRPWIARMR
jgi:hypothetical protein